MENENLKITIILKDNPKLLANANVAIKTIDFGFITIKGFQIWKSERLNDRLQEYINITPPTKQFKGRYFYQVFFEDNSKWPELEMAVYDAYCLKRSSQNKNIEEVNVDDIPL